MIGGWHHGALSRVERGEAWLLMAGSDSSFVSTRDRPDCDVPGFERMQTVCMVTSLIAQFFCDSTRTLRCLVRAGREILTDALKRQVTSMVDDKRVVWFERAGQRADRRTSRIIFGTGNSLAIIWAVCWACWWRGGAIHFDVDQMRRGDAANLSALRADLQVILEWKPSFAELESTQILTDWMRLPENAAAERWEELGRGELREFALINGMVKLLSQESDITLASLRALEEEKWTQALFGQFKKIAARRREASLAKLVSLPQNHLLLQRWQVPRLPHSITSRSLWSWLFGADPEAATLWARRVHDAIDEQVEPVEQFYRELDSKEPFQMGPDAQVQLVLKRLVEQDKKRPTVIYAGHRSLSDWELWVRVRPDLADEPDEQDARVITDQRQEWDTGIRLVCVPWHREENRREEASIAAIEPRQMATSVAATNSEPANGRTSLIYRPVWPPDATCVGCDLPRLNLFLRDMGMPRMLSVAAATLQTSGNWDRPQVTLQVTMASRQFPEWRHMERIDLLLPSWSQWQASIAGMAQAARENLRLHIVQNKQYCGCPVQFSMVPDEPRSIRLHLVHPHWGDLHLSGSLDDDGLLVWQPLPPVEDRLRITERLLQARPELQGHADRLILTAIELSPNNNQLEVRWRIRPLPGETTPALIVWQANTQSMESSSPPAIPILPPSPSSSRPSVPAGEVAATEQEIRDRIEQHLRREYLVLSKFIRVLTSASTAGVTVHLGLKISDWPEVSLGPVTVLTARQAVEAVDQLLAAESVQMAAAEQWHDSSNSASSASGPTHAVIPETLAHARYGQIQSEITAWNPRKGQATIHSLVKFPYLGDLGWDEKTEADRQGAWSQLDEVALSVELRPAIDFALSAAQDEMLSWISLQGIGGRIELDPLGIDGNRWLSMNPPRIALRCWAKIPFLGVKLQGGRCLLDQQGLHRPKEIGLAIPGTIALPYFALSEPAIAFGMGKRSLSLAGKVTPPTLPGPVNPWLGIGYTELAVGGELASPGWKAPKLQGSGEIAVGGVTNLAQGGLSVDLEQGDLDGNFLAKAPLPGMKTVPARLDGRLAYRGTAKSFDMGGRGTILNEEVANLNFGMGKKQAGSERPFDLLGQVRVPYIASLKVQGDAATKLNRFTLRGTGRSGPFLCHFAATEQGVKTRTGVARADGKQSHVDEWDPSLTTLNMPEPGVVPVAPTTALQELVGTFPTRPLTAAELQFARDRLALEADQQQPEESTEELVRESDVPPIPYREYDSKAFRKEGTTLVVVTPDQRVLCRIPAEAFPGIELNRNGLAMIIEWQEKGGGELLFCQADQGKWIRISYDSNQAIRPSETQTFESLGLPPALDPQSASFVAERDLLWRTIKVAFELGVLRSAGQGDLLRPQRLPYPEILNGYAFDIPPRSDRNPDLQPDRRWLWLDENILLTIDLASPWVSREWEQRADFSAAIQAAERGLRSYLSRPLLLATLVAAKPPSESSPNWSLGWAVHRRKDLPHDLFAWETTDTLQQIKLADHSLTDDHLYARGQATIRAAWKQPALQGRVAWVGAAGTFIDAETRFWIIADRGLDEPELGSLSRQHWIDWTGEHVRFLPHAWQSREARRNVAVEQLANSVVRDWESIRGHDTDFQVQPLGLLLLAAREEQAQRPPATVAP